MEIDQRVKWGWVWVAVCALCAYNIRTLYDIQGWDMPPVLGGILTFGLGSMFAVQLIITLTAGSGKGGSLTQPPRRECICAAWLDENRVAHGLTTQRFPDNHILGRFHYVDCPLRRGVTA
jgi:hypothetical protein